MYVFVPNLLLYIERLLNVLTECVKKTFTDKYACLYQIPGAKYARPCLPLQIMYLLV